MQNPLEFYTKEKLFFQTELNKIKKTLNLSSILRLVVFALIVFGIYFFFGNAQAMILTIFIGIAIFLFLVSKHTNLQHKRDKFRKQLKQKLQVLKYLIGLKSFLFYLIPFEKTVFL